MSQYLLTPTAEPSFGGGAVTRFVQLGHDPREAIRVYQDAYGGARFDALRADAPFSFRYAGVGDDRVSLRSSTCTGHVIGEVPHLHDYVVSWFRAGTGELRRASAAQSTATSALFLLPAGQRFALQLGPHQQSLVHFARAFLEDVATEFHAGPPQAVAFDLDALPAADAIGRWRTALGAATAVLRAASAAPLLRFNAQRPLARALLQLFPWLGVDVPPVLREPSLAKTRVALEFLHHHAHEPITPADAARAAGLHTRTLQTSTRHHLGVSPSSYLRGIRLLRVRSDLIEGTPDSCSVSDVAHRWGFGHLGRFSAAYRARFDERPCDTLRR
ncbi:AraC family transcriptional regulator [Microbacteriaceae bacterium VKM Ac-2854]|nr:AraC family transcriptional regulator [Microbacteriaceae bacterium VKM Ac-2854]